MKRISDPAAEFSKDDTLAVKGLAVILMMIHHLLAFPQKLPESLQPIYLIPVPGTDIPGVLKLIALFGKICVPSFFFLAGFGQYRSWEQRGGQFNTLSHLKKLYLAYWKVFVLFVPIALLFFANQEAIYESSEIYGNYRAFDLFACIRSFFGAEAVYNGEWWFIRPWVICTVMLPLWTTLIRKHSFPVNLLFLLLLSVCYQLSKTGAMGTMWDLIFGQTAYGLCFYLGAVMARDHQWERFMETFHRHRIDSLPVVLSMLVFLTVLRVGWPAYNMEMAVFLVPLILLLFSLLIRKGKRFHSFCCLFGRYSTTIWLTHTFLIFYFLPCQKLIFWPRYACLIVPWYLAVCLGLAGLIDWIWSIPGRIVHSGTDRNKAPINE